MRTYRPSSLQDVKKMFASEHVHVVHSIFGDEYYDAKTKQPMPKRKALQILAGEY